MNIIVDEMDKNSKCCDIWAGHVLYIAKIRSARTMIML